MKGRRNSRRSGTCTELTRVESCIRICLSLSDMRFRELMEHSRGILEVGLKCFYDKICLQCLRYKGIPATDNIHTTAKKLNTCKHMGLQMILIHRMGSALPLSIPVVITMKDCGTYIRSRYVLT